MVLFMKYDLICDFTGSYRRIKDACFEGSQIRDLSHIPETNGYCSDEAKEKIRSVLNEAGPDGTHYIDDGNHHYMSYFMLEKIREPFDLIVFDHHTDLQPSALLPFLSCGNWVLESLHTVKMLKKVILIGPPKDDCRILCASEYADRIITVPEETANQEPVFLPGDLPVYISVDLDILSEKEFKTVWDQGSMTWERLHQWLEVLQECKKPIGTDICG